MHLIGEAHPRSRGENRADAGISTSIRGSSPLTRGKLLLHLGGGGRGRLIPAHAGKTRSRRSPSRPRGAHPRSRGENVNWVRTSHYTLGSSPLTRGKLAGQHPDHLRTRLIPAHAGKTRRRRPVRPSSPAHPRSRGENPRRRVRQARLRGLIPAHAGKTLVGEPLTEDGGAHPRSRGENFSMDG